MQDPLLTLDGAEQLAVIITGANCHVFIEGKLVRQLHLDPTRRIQPIYPRRGQPPKVAKHG